MVRRQSLDSTWIVISKELCGRNHPEIKPCLAWGRGVKFPAGFIQDAPCSWCAVIQERGGCCMSPCAGPQNSDFPFVSKSLGEEGQKEMQKEGQRKSWNGF